MDFKEQVAKAAAKLGIQIEEVKPAPTVGEIVGKIRDNYPDKLQKYNDDQIAATFNDWSMSADQNDPASLPEWLADRYDAPPTIEIEPEAARTVTVEADDAAPV